MFGRQLNKENILRDITLRWFIEDEFVYTDTLNDYDFDCFINIENGEICLFCEAGDDDFTGIRYEKADNKTREQFTGMTDINNNKIYEKDILDDRSGSVWLVSFLKVSSWPTHQIISMIL